MPASAEPGLTALPRGPLQRTDGTLYRQVVHILHDAIRTGKLPIGDSLPKERDLAARFGVSLITVRSALSDLEQAGLLEKRSAKPAVVIAREPRARADLKLRGFSDIAAFTLDAKLVVRTFRQERSLDAEGFFQLKSGTRVPCLRGVLTRKNVPVSQITSYFHPSFKNRLARTDFDEVLIFRTLQKRLGTRFAGARVQVRAELAEAATAAELDYAVGGPLLAVEMQYRSSTDDPVELTFGKYRADLFSLTYDVVNDQP